MTEQLIKPDPKLTLTQRINAAMNDVAYIQREKKIVPGAGYRPVSHQAVIGEVRPILIKWGIVIVPSECLKSETIQYTSDKGKPMFYITLVQGYRIVNADNQAEQFTCSICATGADQSDKGANKALTMTEKQLFLKLFHIEVGDDAESAFDGAAPTPEQVATVSLSQIQILIDLGKSIGVAPELIARSMGCDAIEEIPALKFAEIQERLLKRKAQLTPVQNGAAA